MYSGDQRVYVPTCMPAKDLAAAMRRRREELRLTQMAAADVSQLSRTTWRELEAARRKGLSAPTAGKLDEFLGWPPGTATEVFHGVDTSTMARIREIADQQHQLTRAALHAKAAMDAQAIEQWTALLRRLTPEALTRVFECALAELQSSASATEPPGSAH